MKECYFELENKRNKYALEALRGHLDHVPEPEQERAREAARYISVLNTPHDGKPGPDCPF